MANKLNIDPATDTWKASLAAVMDAGREDYRDSSVFLMNTADADDYARVVVDHFRDRHVRIYGNVL